MPLGQKQTVEQLDQALIHLDKKLEEIGVPDPIEIKAIGGYALMKHGIRPEDRAFTVDIDTVTRRYQKSVLDAIAEVGREHGLDEDWLNNYNVDEDPTAVTDLIGDDWQEQGTEHLSRISVAIASVPMLTRAKIFAVADHQATGRTQDKPDLAALLEHQGITDLQQFDRAYPDEYGVNESARRFVADHLGQPLPEPQISKMDEIDKIIAGLDTEFDTSDIDDFGSTMVTDDPFAGEFNSGGPSSGSHHDFEF